MATQDFQSARLFGASEPLLKVIESRGRVHSAECGAMGIEQIIDYALQTSMKL